jgi:hypothetical protein
VHLVCSRSRRSRRHLRNGLGDDTGGKKSTSSNQPKGSNEPRTPPRFGPQRRRRLRTNSWPSGPRRARDTNSSPTVAGSGQRTPPRRPRTPPTRRCQSRPLSPRRRPNRGTDDRLSSLQVRRVDAVTTAPLGCSWTARLPFADDAGGPCSWSPDRVEQAGIWHSRRRINPHAVLVSLQPLLQPEHSTAGPT